MRVLLLACLFFVICSNVLSSESESGLRPASNDYKLREEESSAALDLVRKPENKYHQRKTKERDYQNNGASQKVHYLNSVNKGKVVYGGGDLNKPRKKRHSGAPSNVFHASFLSTAVGPVVIGLVTVTLFF